MHNVILHMNHIWSRGYNPAWRVKRYLCLPRVDKSNSMKLYLAIIRIVSLCYFHKVYIVFAILLFYQKIPNIYYFAYF